MNGNKEKNNIFGDVVNTLKTATKASVDVIGKGIKVTTTATSNMLETQKIKSNNKEIDKKILEHKYNIGKYIYDNEIEIDDGIIISTINTIDRLIDEIKELEGNKNG